MNLYHFEVETDLQTFTVIVSAKDDEAAFRKAEIEVEKSKLRLPVIKDITLIERKIIKNSQAFVIE